jgi:hypothetical protein
MGAEEVETAGRTCEACRSTTGVALNVRVEYANPQIPHLD